MGARNERQTTGKEWRIEGKGKGMGTLKEKRRRKEKRPKKAFGQTKWSFNKSISRG